MSVAYKIKPTLEKKKEIDDFLNSYWGKDLWDIRDIFFDNLGSPELAHRRKTIDFSAFNPMIRREIKYMFAYRLEKKEIKLSTVAEYGKVFNNLAAFLNKYYAGITSIVYIPYDKATLQWRSFLLRKKMKVNAKGEMSTHQYRLVFNQLHSFFVNLYDTIDEYEKDVWDCRKISGAKITESKAQYHLDFTHIPLEFRELVKRYLKFRTTINSCGQCTIDIMALRLFFNYIHTHEPSWKDLKNLTRKHMEDYLVWYKNYSNGWKRQHISGLINLRIFFEYIQRAMYLEAPEVPAVCLIFKEDIPRRPYRTEDDIKYIPDDVLKQLEDNLEYLAPSEYIPIVVLLRASGWRISDILNLRYDTCLERTTQGWYLCGDIVKTQFLNHHVPITDEVAAIVQSTINDIKEKSTYDNNPNHLLFVRFEGKRKGRCPTGEAVKNALNRLAITKNITDFQGNIFHFGNHAFRHTKGVELINNGMNLLYVQKWMAHASPEMTLQYAKILDTTMRKSWEEATRQGIFKIDEFGKLKEINASDIRNKDIIEWEYIRKNLDVVRMPFGYCMKPKKLECHTQSHPCLTCRNLCTTPDFIPQYEIEIQETKALIERGKSQSETMWVDKNQFLLEKYTEILSVLKEGKIYHIAGKKGREYIVEDDNNGK